MHARTCTHTFSQVGALPKGTEDSGKLLKGFKQRSDLIRSVLLKDLSCSVENGSDRGEARVDAGQGEEVGWEAAAAVVQGQK